MTFSRTEPRRVYINRRRCKIGKRLRASAVSSAVTRGILKSLVMIRVLLAGRMPGIGAAELRLLGLVLSRSLLSGWLQSRYGAR
jgi:hypothetical protein